MKKRHERTHRSARSAFAGAVAAALLILGGICSLTATSGAERSASAAGGDAAALVELYHSISLTAEQEETKNRALLGMPAPCCSRFPMATCCCACNLAKAVWGLAKHLIAEKGYGPERVRAGVESWLAGVNPDGFAGDACFEGRCNLPFHRDGCGGMREETLS